MEADLDEVIVSYSDDQPRSVTLRALLIACFVTLLVAGGAGVGASYLLLGTDDAEVSKLRADVASLRDEHETLQAKFDALRGEVQALGSVDSYGSALRDARGN